MADLSLTRSEAEELAHSTFVRSVRFLDETPSTNDVALSESHQSSELPAIFVTPLQTAGRGRGTNRWHSTVGALTFSIVIDPSTLRTNAASWLQLSLWTALGIRDAIAGFTPNADVQVKWPNDVFLRQRKICGILIEGVPTVGQTARRLVIGVGINVHNSLDCGSGSQSIEARAISIAQVRADVAISDVMRSVLKHLEESWSLFAERHSLQRAWQPHCLLTGRSIRWNSGEQSRTGVCQGIHEDGALLLAPTPAEPPIRCYGGTIFDW